MRRLAATTLSALSLASCGGKWNQPASAADPDAGAAPITPLTCEQARLTVENDMFSLLAEHASGCLKDADCMLVSSSLPCLERCEVAVVANDFPLFLDEFNEYAASICKLIPPKCTPGPPCAATVARCTNGGCHAVAP